MTVLVQHPPANAALQNADTPIRLKTAFGQTAACQLLSTETVAAGDPLLITGSVESLSGENNVVIRQNNSDLATLTEVGAFSIEVTAPNASAKFRLVAGGNMEGPQEHFITAFKVEKIDT